MTLKSCEDICSERCMPYEKSGFEAYNSCVEECIYQCATMKDLKIIDKRHK